MHALARITLALPGFALLIGAADAATYRVGLGCDFADLGQAIAYATAHDLDAQVVFQLRSGTQFSGTFGPNYSYASIELLDPAWDIVIQGGFVDCTAATASGYTTMKATRAHEGMLLVDNTLPARHAVVVRGVRFVDASDSVAVFFWDKIDATLGAGVEVSNSGGGIDLRTETYQPDSSAWPSLTLTEGANVHDNQGSGITALGTVTLAGANVDNNHADSGAGIYLSEADSQLILDSSGGDNSISGNVATDNGGGICLDHASLLIKQAASGINAISFNQAGNSGDPSQGYGGGIVSNGGNIKFHSGAVNAGQHNILEFNAANHGGAIAVKGANGGLGVAYTFVTLLNTRFASNYASINGGALYSLDAVDWTIDRGGLASCGTGPFAPCSVFSGNTADYSYASDMNANGGAIYITDDRSDGYSRGIARFYHTYFADNVDERGTAAVAAAKSYAELVFERNIFTNNLVDDVDDGNNLIDSLTSKNLVFRYNTVMPDNIVHNVLHTIGGMADITGSIILTPVFDGVPLPIWRGEVGAQIKHRGCLVSLVPLIDSNGDSGLAGDAHISSMDFAPGGGSPAIDHCGFVGPIDFNGFAGAADTPGVPPRFGDYDLGAVEQHDIIFYNGFGNRPDN